MISVFVPYYNDRNFLAQCIGSILSQSFTDFELILLNHASTDGSELIAQSYQDKRIKHINLTQNYGAGGGLLMIEALKVATGKYYKPFCADDVMHKDCLQNLYLFLEANQDVDIVFGNMRFVDKDLKPTGDFWWNSHAGLGLNEIEILKHYFNGSSILPYPASMCRLEILKDIEFDKVLHTQFDMTIWVQLLINHYKFKCLEDVVCNYRIHENQASSSSKHQKIINSSMFENIYYVKYFINIQSVKLVKKLLPNDLFAQILKDQDIDLIAFVVSNYYSDHGCLSYASSGLFNLYNIMSNDELRERIKSKFGYQMKDFRAKYAERALFLDLNSVKTSKILKQLRKRIFAKIKTVFLFSRRLGVI